MVRIFLNIYSGLIVVTSMIYIESSGFLIDVINGLFLGSFCYISSNLIFTTINNIPKRMFGFVFVMGKTAEWVSKSLALTCYTVTIAVSLNIKQAENIGIITIGCVIPISLYIVAKILDNKIQ
ncbi:hypothetical protein BCU98_01050 [Vibrio splendidus]|nr:hypothetical protein BCU98_01050 [Vibrio splendidus]